MLRLQRWLEAAMLQRYVWGDDQRFDTGVITISTSAPRCAQAWRAPACSS